MKRKVSFPVPKDIVEKLIKTCSDNGHCECCLEEIPNIYKCALCDKSILLHKTCDVRSLKCLDCRKILCNDCVKFRRCDKPIAWNSYWSSCKRVFKRCSGCEGFDRCEKCDVEACNESYPENLAGSFVVTHVCDEQRSGWRCGVLGFISQEDVNKL